MQEKIINQLGQASQKTILDNNSSTKTSKFFKAADILLQEAIDKPEGRLKGKMDANGHILRRFISDAYIAEKYKGQMFERPVIDLVQQGGGMYGIALLGYTYIMEKVGIRFYSHGGTSAGAINAMFLAAISNEVYQGVSTFQNDQKAHQAMKSEILTHIITNTEFSSFMEKGGVVGKLQEMLFKNFKSIGLKLILGFSALLFLVAVYASFSSVFSASNGVSGGELRVFDFIIGTLNVGALFLFVYILLIKILNVKFGINTGDVFYKWADDLLTSLNINDSADLKRQMSKIVLHPAKEGDEPRLVLITSNLSHNRIVKFPERAEDYWCNPDDLKPAAFLRATMSLPFIYKTFIPDTIHYYHQNNPDNGVKLKARFVDGGLLSNFPIREFHRSDNIIPRFPTFGVLLSERKDSKETQAPEEGSVQYQRQIKEAKALKSISLMGYIVSFLSTFRNFYDNDFLLGNEEIQLRVETVNTKGFNWLDFWMKDTTKKALFKEGAIAAIRQLEKFDWGEYKSIRK